MNDFRWRPNDNSVTTNLRYDLEAEHWVKSYKSALEKNKPANFTKDLAVIGLIISLVFNIIWFILICLLDFLIWARKIIKKSTVKNSLNKMDKTNPITPTKEILDAMWKNSITVDDQNCNN